MKKMFLLVFLMGIMGITLQAQEVKFNAEKSQLKWTGKKVAGEHWGYINLKSGSMQVKGDKIVSGRFVIDMNTITVKDLDAGEWNDKLVGHLKSDDFFSVAKFSESILVIEQSTPFNKGEAQVNAKLTIKGITHPVTFKAVKTSSGYSASVTVDRSKYDVRYGSGKFFEGLGDKMIYDDFILDVNLVQ